jgi:hypothetical protein
MALYGGAFVFGVLADVLEAKNARECKGKVDVPESAHQKDGARRRRSFEEACATVAATVTSVSAAALGVGEESEDENEMGPEEEPLGAMRSEGATDLGD